MRRSPRSRILSRLRTVLLLALCACAGAACERHSPLKTVPGYAEKLEARREAGEQPLGEAADRPAFFPGKDIH